jgi:hypothetical protein
MRISRASKPLAREVEQRLEEELSKCPDLAFAHLPEVHVPEQQAQPELVLFVWLVPEALRSLRSALNLVSEAVARALPEKQYLDVVILNSAPELLADVEDAGCLLVERSPEERQRALAAADSPPAADEPRKSPWWWPF